LLLLTLATPIIWSLDMPVSSCRSVIALALLFPASLQAQSRAVEIGMDGGLEYSFDANLLTIAVPFQRVRAAFPMEDRLALEPSLSFMRLSANGESFATLAMRVGVLYDLEATRGNTFARPFAGFEYVDASFGDSDTAFNLGVGIGTRSSIADQLALRIEANLMGRFGAEGGTDGVVGATVGLSFFTR
jgi:outer membrane protein with beta-barrel domain